MKFLLTSAGIKNASIHDALIDLLGKPIAESNALCIPTAGYGHPHGSPGGAWRFITGQSHQPHVRAGLEVRGCAGAHRAAQHRQGTLGPWVRETDVLLVNGGDALYLCYWMRQSGLADLLPSLRETVWVGLSAGSMVMTPRIGADFVGWKPPTGGDETLGIVDFSIFPHLDHELLPENTMADAETMGRRHPGPAYAIDDETAITGGRRHRRGRLRGALEAVYSLRRRGQRIRSRTHATNTQPCAVWRRMIPSCGPTGNVCAPADRLRLTPFVPGL